MVFGTLVGVFLFSVKQSELLMTSAISCPLWSSVQVPESGVCIHISGVVCLYVRVDCFIVRGCAVSRRYINAFNCDMFSVVNVCLDHLKLCIVCMNGRRYGCCSKCNVVSNECNEPTPCLVQHIGAHSGEVMYFECVCFRGELGILNCNVFCMYVMNNQFELLEFVFSFRLY